MIISDMIREVFKLYKKNKMYKPKLIYLKLLMSFVISISAENTIAQKRINIVGKVTDSTEKKQLHNAVINILRSKDSILKASARSDKEGQFGFDVKGDGKYILMVSYPQYADYVDKIELTSGQELNLNTDKLDYDSLTEYIAMRIDQKAQRNGSSEFPNKVYNVKEPLRTI